jgi:precorrin-6B methylase 2
LADLTYIAKIPKKHYCFGDHHFKYFIKLWKIMMNQVIDNTVLEMRHMITGFQVTQAIYTAAKLSIADYIHQGITSCDQLAKLTQTKSDKLYRLLRALTSVGIFFEIENQHFTLTEKAKLLCTDHPNSLKHYAMMYGEEAYTTWKQLLVALNSETSVFETLYQKPLFEYLEGNTEANQTFNLAMKNSTASQKAAVVSQYDFSQFQTICDVGGGTGELLIEILEAFPSLQTTLYEQASVINQAKKVLEKTSYADSIKLISGDFFKSIPSNYDVYIMRHIVHDWPLDKAKQILSHCFEAMNHQSTLLLIEGVIQSRNIKDPLKWIDLHMMVTLNGKERTETEFAELLNACKLKMRNIISIPDSHLSIIEIGK